LLTVQRFGKAGDVAVKLFGNERDGPISVARDRRLGDLFITALEFAQVRSQRNAELPIPFRLIVMQPTKLQSAGIATGRNQRFVKVMVRRSEYGADPVWFVP